jgi:succinate dehydrogenase/fumarate reductase flavoprotein subunit
VAESQKSEAIAGRTDVLIIGGGMAAAWAAVSAARQGADVILVDKGFVGTSGVTATGGPNHWWVAPDAGRREAAIEERYARSYGLADREWMARIIDTTWRTLPELAAYYPFDTDGRGGTYYSGLRGPEYLRALRRYARATGVRILDHHPALELLLHDDGSVAGAAGFARLARTPWTIHAASVVLATGGCAFRSGLIGSDTNTGDGYLMAAEAGAELSGMEFSAAYSLSPAWNSTRTLPYPSARFFDVDGREIDVPPGGPAHNRALATAMLAGPVFADLSDAPALLKQILPRIQPASPAPFERKGLDLFKDRFEVKLFGEGTIRGIGGLRIVDADCQTTVRGLFAAGDAATRELIAGATSGGGAQNSAWALTSGLAAGEGAAAAARRQSRRAGGRTFAVGAAGLRPTASPRPIDAQAIVAGIQSQALAYDKVLWRDAATLTTGRALLDDAWNEIAAYSQSRGLDQIRAREVAAMAATARWCNAAALARSESRGMHVRTDMPALSPAQEYRLLTGGIDRIWTRPDIAARAPRPAEVAA